MRRVRVFAVPLLLLVSCSSSGSAGDAATTAPPVTTAAPPVTTAAPVTTAEPTTAAPTTAAPATTAAPTTTVVVTDPVQVSFRITGQDVTPVEFKDPRATAAAIHASLSGDVSGTMTIGYVSMGDSRLGLAWLEGAATPCGDGGVVMRIGSRPDGQVGWEIVDGLGTGALASATGSGFENVGAFTGSMSCQGPTHSGVVVTSLLEPMPLNGAAAAYIDHGLPRQVSQQVPIDPAQSTPPTSFEFDEGVYTDGTHNFSVLLGKPAASHGPLRNTFAMFQTSINGCGVDGVTRVLMDDLLFEEFTGVWDVPAALNGGVHGSGIFDAKQSTGRMVCS